MRTTVLAGVLILAAAVGTARADENVTGSYDVKFEEMASNCSPPPVALGRGKLTIEIKKGSLFVNTDLIPQMSGVPAKGGKINANSGKKPLDSTVQGLQAKYSIAGRLEGGVLQLVLIAEYINAANQKPYCTQSWNISGATATDKKPDKKAKPAMAGFTPELFSSL